MKTLVVRRCASRRSFLRGIPVITAAAALAPAPALAADGKHHWRCSSMRANASAARPHGVVHPGKRVPQGSFRTNVSTYSVKLTDADQPAGT